MPWAAGAALLTLAGVPAAAQEVVCETEGAPYLFVLFDTSGSLSWSPACSQAEIDAGSCSYLCNSPECRVPLQADSPDSKLSHLKAGLYEVLASPESENVLFGFATFNQDALYARSKHWLYQAAADGVTIPGYGPFPATGSRDVLGRTWNCDEGTGDNEVGCVATNPADLSDAWELERVRTLAKGGETLTTAVTFYVRQMPTIYRIRYTPVSGTLGSAVNLKVRIDRCMNVACSSVTNLGEPTLSYTPVSEYLVWENGAFRTEPVGYFGQSGSADASASNTCAGWDPNTDTAADKINNLYTLRWPTGTGDARGTYFDRGDVLPLDWLDDHRQAIRERLAPNVVADPLADPDFRTSSYLRDTRLGAEVFLRLKDERFRPLIASGSTPLGTAMRSFRAWYAGCASGVCPSTAGWQGVAKIEDPLFDCRRKNLVLITDGEDTCGTVNACSVADDLYGSYGVRTFVVAFGAHPAAATAIHCIASDGGTTAPYEAHLRPDLVQALEDVFVAAGQP